jgi:dTDP-4-amino-4,6-dideoxygalactose transaminase
MIPYAKHSTDKRDGRAAADVIEHGWLSQGPKVREFEAAFAARVGARHAVAVSSGTAALHLACLAAGLGKGDKAIVPAMTFLATANAVLYCGARPVFCDVDPATLNLDLETAARRADSKTRAILPVHYAGYPCDLKSFHSFFKKKKLIVIEDACHALGSTNRGETVGSCRWSDMAVFSFHPTKAITTGEGGMVTTNDPVLHKLLCDLRNHGMVKDPARFRKKPEGPWAYEMQHLGFNYRLTDFQSALGLSQLSKLDGFLARRRKLVALYVKEIADLAGVEAVGENDHDTSFGLRPVREQRDRLGQRVV